MANPVNAGDPAEYLAQLAAILPVGTTVAASSVIIQKGLDTETVQFPALILNCPRSNARRITIGTIGATAYQSFFEVHGMYLDRWETGTRTLEQILADASTALQQMRRNVQQHLGLNFDSVQADEDIYVTVDGPVSDPGLGFPLVTGEITIKVKGAPYN